MLKRNKLISYLNKKLNIYQYSDYCPNGLQIEGANEIKSIAFAVSATKESIDKAIALGVDTLIVHHGLFWKFHGPKTITGAFHKRVAPLIINNINLVGYHLPLDGHIELGNAAAIAKKLSLSEISEFGDHKGMHTGVKGKFTPPISPNDLTLKLEEILEHKVIHSAPNTEKIKSIGIITGGANSDWTKAKAANLDSYLTGEISEHDWHEAKEDNIHYFAGGHNATEQFGVQSLLEDIHREFKQYELELFFIPSSNPA